MKISPRLSTFFWQEIHQIYQQSNSRLAKTRQFTQHGDTSVFEHSVRVAWLSCSLAEHLHLPVNYKTLIHGAVLHDYFLYDWHTMSIPHRTPHGFYHPSAALKNAMKDFSLSRKEQNIILRHMFPLTPIPPTCLEGWVVSIADKICSVEETFHKDEAPAH